MRTVAILTALIALSPVTTSVAVAQTARAVSTAGLDPTNPGHMKDLDRRIARAIEAVCGSYASVEPGDYKEITTCRRDATAHVKGQLAARQQQTYLAAAR